MRNIPPALQSHLDGKIVTLSACWKIVRTDGQEFRFTDHDAPIIVDGDPYIPAGGTAATAVRQTRDLSVDNLEARVGFSDTGVVESDIWNGLFDMATVDVFLVNWADPSQGGIQIATGWTVGEIRIRDNECEIELRAKSQKLDQDYLEVCSPACRAVLGDERCGIDLYDTAGTYSYDGSVSSVAVARTSFIDDATIGASGDDDVYSNGVLTWTSGLNIGASIEVKSWEPSTGVFVLFLPTFYSIGTGDEFTVTWGCDHEPQTCRDRFDNIKNFRGEPFVPGLDAVLRQQTSTEGE